MIYTRWLRPMLFQGNPEWVHEQFFHSAGLLQQFPEALTLLSQRFAPPIFPELSQSVFGMPFQTPIGLAAGFDKNLQLLPFLQALGFGFMEAGSISAEPALGNPKPRLFRLPQDEALLNRMGLNNKGVAALQKAIAQLPTQWPVGISLVKTPNPKIMGNAGLEDFGSTLKAVYGHGGYISLNISCPNTAEGKTFEDPDALDTLLGYLRQVEADCQSNLPGSSRPWLLKSSPDITPQQIEELFEVGCRHNIAGWIACNTSARRDTLKTSSQYITQLGYGGISGAPVQAASTKVLGQLYQLGQAKQPNLVFIGVGGVRDVNSAWEKITHGATLLQLYTGLIYEGPGLLKKLQVGLHQKLQAQGLTHLDQAVGLAFR